MPTAITQSGYTPDGSSISRTLAFSYNSAPEDKLQLRRSGPVLTITQTPNANTEGTSSARITQYTYTAVGDLASVTFPDGRSLSYLYDAARMLRQITDNAGNQVRYSYDAKDNHTQQYTYDPSNTLVRQIDIAYDLRNYVSQLNAAGSLTSQIHDAVGNLTSQTDPNNNPTVVTSQFRAIQK